MPKKLKRICSLETAVLSAVALIPAFASAQTWDGYAGNAQHTALSTVASQPLDAVHWQTPVDLDPQYSGGELFIHYGSPVITANNTVIVPTKTGANSGFELNAFNGATGANLWTQTTDYAFPPQNGTQNYSWTPSYGPTLATGNTLYYPGDGGTVYERGNLNSPGPVTPTQEAFFGSLSTYTANMSAFNANVAISTPITADSAGDIFFGYQTTTNAPSGLTSGIAEITASGTGSFFPANQLMVGNVNAGMVQVVNNCAPAVTTDDSTVYVAMSNGNFGTGYLVALSTATMKPTAKVALVDPKTKNYALLPNDGTASPMIGPDGDVYMGVFDDKGSSRGWMEHFSADLSATKTAGGFGWDDTASIVPASMVPSYHGSSTYLIMTKYNNYADPGTGGNGQNMIAILDPNDTQTDTRFNSNGAAGATIMKVVESILGPTPDANFDQQFPGAVHEWCINTAAVDPATDSVIVNSEDGNLYRWNLTTNTLIEEINITNSLGEAYTPTVIGPDGTAYAINNATLWAIGSGPTPNAVTWASAVNGNWSSAPNWAVTSVPTAAMNASFNTGSTNAYTVTLNANSTAGNLLVNGDNVTIQKAGFNLNVTSSVTIASSISGSGTLTLAGTGVTTVGSLTILGTGRLDITDNKVVINYGVGNPSPINSIGGYISAGYNGATFTGPGIVSSKVASVNSAHTNSHLYAIGYADASDLAVQNDGFAPGTVVVEPALVGDANLDDTVNFTDFQLLAASFNGANTSWSQGNFNYSNKTDFTDFQLLAANFNDSTSLDNAELNSMEQFAANNGYAMTPNPDGNGFTLTSIPEPTLTTAFLIAAPAILTRRARPKNKAVINSKIAN